MSKIVFHNSVPEQSTYKLALQQKITEVCRAIEFDDSDIIWKIFNNSDFNVKKHAMNCGWDLEGLFTVKRGEDYGYCYPKRNEVWISILALQQDTCALKNISTGLALPLYRDGILADVLIDEITHMQTKRDHNDPYYNFKFEENKSKYFRRT